MAVKRPINVTITGDYNDKDINRAIKDMQSLKTQGDNTSQGMSNFGKGLTAVGGAIAATFAVGKITDFFQSSIAGAMEDQKSMVALAKAMENVGLAGQNSQVEAFISKLSLARGVADDELRPALQKLITATGDVAVSQKMLGEAMDISAATGRDLGSVSKALAMAEEGHFGALTKMGIPLSASIIKTKDFAAAQKVLDERFGGQSAAAAETYQGKMNRVTVAANEAKETIGYALLNALDSVSTAFGGTGGATSMITQFGKEIATDVKGIGYLALQIALLKKSLDDMTSGFKLGGNSVVDFIWKISDSINPVQKAIDSLHNLAAAQDALDMAPGGSKASGGMSGHTLGSKGLNAYKDLIPVDPAVTASTTTHGTAVDYVAQAYTKLKTAYESWYKSGFDTLKTKLDEATAAFDSFKVSVRDSIAGALNFGDAAQEFDDKGAKVGKSFIEKLQDQAALAVGFADKVKQLIAMNLSKEALTEVLAAGAAAGSSIAGDLIAGGATAIDTTNTLVASAQGAADTVAKLAADKWFGTGVKSAQDSVDGFENQFGPKGKSRAKMMNIMDDLASSMSRTATVTVTTINRIVDQHFSSYASGGLDGNPATPFATGGIVTGPTFAMIGEAGPEAVIPLSSPSASNYLSGGGGGSTYNVTINGPAGGDPRQFGQLVIESISKWERANGAYYAKAV